MSMDELNSMSFLDKMRINNGINNLKTFFNELSKSNLKKAINLVNEENLHYASLFVLQPEINTINLSTNLNSRNKAALEITNRFLSEEDLEYSPPDSPSMNYSVLKWIIETGFYDDGLNDEYSMILDICAAILTTVYKDKTILPTLADMIFVRNRKQVNNYDLVWAFFECHDPQCMFSIAEGLHSSYKEDIYLARKFLNFVPDINMNDDIEPNTQYSAFTNWLDENQPFLYFTGESFLQTCRPELYRISHEAKYLCKVISPETSMVLEPLTHEEKSFLKNFKEMDDSTKTFLSKCSIILHDEDISKWDEWLHYPIAEQIKFARNKIGGMHNDYS